MQDALRVRVAQRFADVKWRGQGQGHDCFTYTSLLRLEIVAGMLPLIRLPAKFRDLRVDGRVAGRGGHTREIKSQSGDRHWPA